ncbi:hypothetical protein AVEN_12485-1, partial [Araneus ventricosus]
MLKIYRATVLSKLEYGCTIYGSARKSVLQKLDPVHHTVLRLCSGAFRTSPVKSLYVECYEPALELKRQMLSLHYYFKIQSNSNHPFHDFKLRPFLLRLQNARKSFIPVFFTRVHDILSDLNLLYLHVTPHPKTNFPPWGIPVVQFLNPFKTFIRSDTADIVYQQIFIEHRQEYNDFIAIYTDGSKSADHVSFAVVFPNTTLSFKLHSSCSVFTAEIAAVLLALEQISDFLERKFIIYTDSLSVLESLKSFYMHSHHHPLVLNVLHLLNKLASRDFNIILCWVPSHVGIVGNEEADKAAKLASTQTNSTVPLTDFKKYIKLLFHTKWERQWDTETENKLHAVKPHVQPWPSLMNRKADTLLTRLRFGAAWSNLWLLRHKTKLKLLTRVNVPRVIPQRPERYIFDKADWASFTTRAKITWDIVQYPDLNVAIDNVTASILRAADETIPKSSTKFPKLRKPWWNRQCTETRKNQQIAWNKFRRHPTVANLIAFQRAKSIARRQAQRESWIKLISNINSSISVTDMWNLVKKACGIYPDYPLSYLR